MEQDELNERLAGADHVPVHLPPGASRVEDSTCLYPRFFISDVDVVLSGAKQAIEDDEDAQLKELQQALAM